jgi:hypothetical protein
VRRIRRVEEHREGEEGTMSLEQRMNFLLTAAQRAERNGEHHIARALRRMAEDIRPIDLPRTASVTSRDGG